MRFLRGNNLWGHPKGLFILFLTEMWERFSYYGMRSLLVYYMIRQLTFNQGMASHIYGAYTGLVYLSPCLGGFLADRVIGRRKAVILGGVLMALGHFMMSSEPLFFAALLFLVLGNGLFKPNIASQVGELYNPLDERRDRAFSIFYVGVNLGAFFSPLVCGSLGELYGWHYGFNAAGIGMLIGLSIYLAGQKWLRNDTRLSGKLIQPESILPVSRRERNNLSLLIAVGLVSVAFWAAFEQQGNTMALWAASYTDRNIFGWEFPASWFQSMNPALVFLLTPIITTLWSRQAKNNREPSALLKMAIGCFLLALAFVIMIPAARLNMMEGEPVSVSWLVAFSLVATLGELYLSPVGLSLVTRLAPIRMVSMMMGVWFLSSFAGNYTAGFLGQYWEKMQKELFFLMVAVIVFISGIAMLLISRRFKSDIRLDQGI